MKEMKEMRCYTLKEMKEIIEMNELRAPTLSKK